MSGDIKDPKNFIPEPQGEEGILRADGTEDLQASPSLETLGGYLSNITKAISPEGTTAFVPSSPNQYPVSDQIVEAPTLGNGTTRAPIQTGGSDSTQETYTGTTSEPGAASYFENLKRGSYMVPPGGESEDPGEDDLFDKNEGIAGHSLLSDFKSHREPYEPGVGDVSGKKTFEVPSGAPAAQQRISAILGHNRFTPMAGSSPHIEDGEFSNPGIAASQSEMGVYDSESSLTSAAYQSIMTELTLLRATGHRMNSHFPTTNAQLRAVTRPASAVQAGASTVNIDKLRVKNTADDPTHGAAPNSVEIPDTELTVDDITGAPLEARRSFGVLNSPYEPFASFGAGKMMRVTIRAFSRLLVEGGAFVAILSLLEFIDDAIPPADVTGMRYGHHLNTGSIVGEIVLGMGVPELRFSMWRCYVAGIQRFFGMPDSALPSGLAAAAAIGFEALLVALGTWITDLATDIATDPSLAFDIFFNVMFSAGYYASLTRSMNQDLSALLNDIAGLGADPNDNAASAAVRMLFNFNSYTSFRFVIALCTMGNAALTARTRVFPTAGGQAQMRSTMPDNGRTRVGKSRLRRNSRKQALRHSSAPALFLLPKKHQNAWAIFHNQYYSGELKSAMKMVGDNSNNPSAADPYQGQRRRPTLNLDSEMNHPFNYSIDGSGSRLHQGLVVEMENELEMEYMPFYFHDLRTNEVIGFHAFLEDVKDSYSVAYQSTKGYGRIDNVHIYKDTDRSISVSWVMFATSRKDFDSLWFSVNKLITMIYPQWSKGKRVRAGDHKFIQPFSQIPTASPVIRLRVGDVIRSNYSRYNLAKLFGITEAVVANNTGTGSPASAAANADFDISFASASPDPDAVEDAEDAAEAAGEATWEAYQARAEQEPSAPDDLSAGFVVGDICYLKASPSTGYTTFDRGADPESPPPSNATHVEYTPFRSRTNVEGPVISRGQVFKRIWLGGEEGDAMHGVGAGGDPKTTEYLFRFDDRDSDADPYRPVSAKNHFHEYTVTGGDLVPIRAPDPAPEPVEGTVTFTEQVTNIAAFFNPANNAIVSSFEEGMGRGLAGVITSFDMDWKDFTWETKFIGSRAPTALRVSIGFSPIHDIVPGLDHTGFPRTMNYPIGRIANRLNTDRYDSGRSTDPIGNPAPDPPDLTRTRFQIAEAESFGASGAPGDTVETDD